MCQVVEVRHSLSLSRIRTNSVFKRRQFRPIVATKRDRNGTKSRQKQRVNGDRILAHLVKGLKAVHHIRKLILVSSMTASSKKLYFGQLVFGLHCDYLL